VKSPFIIYGMPRSRTFWLSRFLAYSDWDCGHDELRHARSLDDVATWFKRPNIGTVETAAAPFWRLIPSGVRSLVVRRPVSDVIDSFKRIGFEVDERIISRLDAKLNQIEARVPSVLSVQFADLGDEATCARMFEHCLPYQHDHAWWKMFAALNLQTNFANTVRYYNAYRPQLDKLAALAKHASLAAMNPPVQAPDGFTIQQEHFDEWYRDATPLFREHMARTGQAIDDYARKNIPVLRAIDQMGFMTITTARSNGRMFGYLMAVLSPSLDDPEVLSAMHLPFFASDAAPGLGMKLQRASIEALRAKGVGEVFFKAGVRGDGPRLGVLYKRLGAVPVGTMHQLDLRAA
jgi:hypothetical protein